MKIVDLISNTLLLEKLRLEGELEDKLNNPNIGYSDKATETIKTLKQLNEAIHLINLWESLNLVNKNLETEKKDGNIK